MQDKAYSRPRIKPMHARVATGDDCRTGSGGTAEHRRPRGRIFMATRSSLKGQARDDRNSDTAGFVVVVGVSAGGLKALSEFVGRLATGMDAAVFIVMHLSRTSISDFLMLQLQKFTPLPCEIASDGAPIEKGHIYVAAPNVHLLVK
ncbi:MAG TPA: chemotaxis protein CheB, partial [Burkholderiaceae bacterium]|nr:chemotaxis protein CheB [Burkholderiaceae bacterium]